MKRNTLYGCCHEYITHRGTAAKNTAKDVLGVKSIHTFKFVVRVCVYIHACSSRTRHRGRANLIKHSRMKPGVMWFGVRHLWYALKCQYTLGKSNRGVESNLASVLTFAWLLLTDAISGTTALCLIGWGFVKVILTYTYNVNNGQRSSQRSVCVCVCVCVCLYVNAQGV